MTQNDNPTRYTGTTGRPTVPGAPAGVGARPTPSSLGVVPDARLAAAFLTHAFIWMFAGLLVTAGVATIVQSNERLIEFAQGSFFLLMIVQLGIVIGITAAIQRISATAALALFFVYAASLGVTVGLIVSAYTTASV
ncbi:MAG: Bax inhibitor-1 family protein, partial [Chloroflexota bacterium]